MKGIVALIAGIIAVIFGTLSFVVGCGLFLCICLVIGAASWITTIPIVSRAQSHKGAANVGFWLGIIGFAEILWAINRCWL